MTRPSYYLIELCSLLHVKRFSKLMDGAGRQPTDVGTNWPLKSVEPYVAI